MLLRIHVIGGQRFEDCSSLPPHHSDPAPMDFQSCRLKRSSDVIWMCRAYFSNSSCPLPWSNVVYRIPCSCGQVYIGETKRRLVSTQASVIRQSTAQDLHNGSQDYLSTPASECLQIDSAQPVFKATHQWKWAHSPSPSSSKWPRYYEAEQSSDEEDLLNEPFDPDTFYAWKLSSGLWSWLGTTVSPSGSGGWAPGVSGRGQSHATFFLRSFSREGSKPLSLQPQPHLHTCGVSWLIRDSQLVRVALYR